MSESHAQSYKDHARHNRESSKRHMRSITDERTKRMISYKKIKHIRSTLLLLCLFFLFTGCSGNAGQGTDSNVAEDYDLSYSDRDLDASYAEDDATTISLSDNGITVDGSGAKADGNILRITSEGTYIVSGNLSNGQIIINTPDQEKVQIILNGADIASSDNAPLLIKESDKVFLTLASGSRNTLTGPASYCDEATEAGIDGTIYSKADLCINGLGSLCVNAEGGHGIVSKDDLIVTGGDISVTAAGDSLQGKDCVKIKDGAFLIQAENDGIKSSNARDQGRGFVSIDGGSFDITAGYDGIQAETLLRIAEGDVDITTGGGSQNASTQEDWKAAWGNGQATQPPGGVSPEGKEGQNSGNMPNPVPDQPGAQGSEEKNAPAPNHPGAQGSGEKNVPAPIGQTDAMDEQTSTAQNAEAEGKTDSQASDGRNAGTEQKMDSQADVKAQTSTDTDDASAKGLKAGLMVTLSGGGITIDSSDDSIHSNGDIKIENCTIAAMSGDDGIHADAALTVNSGSVQISKSYEGLEGNTITIHNGDLDITASDDGLNAAGGKDQSSANDRPGQNEFTADESAFIEINGGNLAIQACGDGIDSNGTLQITDGTVIVSCPTVGDTAALDFSGTGTISGGTFIGTGAVQMAQTFDVSEQGVVTVSIDEQPAGSAVVLTDSNGNVMFSHEPEQPYTFIILSSPDLISGDSYTLNAGSVSEAVTAD